MGRRGFGARESAPWRAGQQHHRVPFSAILLGSIWLDVRITTPTLLLAIGVATCAYGVFRKVHATPWGRATALAAGVIAVAVALGLVGLGVADARADAVAALAFGGTCILGGVETLLRATRPGLPSASAPSPGAET